MPLKTGAGPTTAFPKTVSCCSRDTKFHLEATHFLSGIFETLLAATIASFTGAIINLIVIMLLDQLYSIIANAINKWENHKTASKYEMHLTFKIFMFQFVNLNASLFYIAFFKGKFTGIPGDYNTFLGYRVESWCGFFLKKKKNTYTA